MLESFPIALMVGTALGILSGLGVGGGSLLLLWLTLVLGMDPGIARGINLVFFLPGAVIACLFRLKQGVLQWKVIVPAAIGGCIAAFIGAHIGFALPMEALKKGFGVLLILTGLRELLYRTKTK
ncbi:MAG TPA: sulfite exporter TauE/SafE family protein [Candidatus Faecousia faecipullorum]|nr:sulfite exporter TauE/SafE family protein [Candidatus Faecousia faecipullorum]